MTQSQIKNLSVVSTKKQSYNYVSIQSLIDSHLVYDGQVTLRHYEWMKSGDVNLVDERDVPELLAKRIGVGSCCGGNPKGSSIFEIYDE